jgi:penicillin-binding protein 1C
MLAAAVVLACVAGIAFWAMLPKTLFAAPESYVLEARDGSLLSARIASDGQWRFPARSTVPEKFRRALLTFEDKRFEEHSGIDGLAIARALRINANAGRVRSGASTITMQLARLSRDEKRRNLQQVAEAPLRCASRLRSARTIPMRAAHAPSGATSWALKAAWRYGQILRRFRGPKPPRSYIALVH